MDYEKDIKIDEDALDVEWLGQASLLIRYARNAAQARMDLDKAKEALDVVKAELDAAIRKEPDKYKIEKITEAVVGNTIILQPKYKETNERYLKAKYEADIAQGAVNAVNQRKDALENLVRLYGQQYFAGPKMPRDLHAEVQARQSKVNTGIAAKMSRRPV